jgi:hypothetical protein
MLAAHPPKWVMALRGELGLDDPDGDHEDTQDEQQRGGDAAAGTRELTALEAVRPGVRGAVSLPAVVAIGPASDHCFT